MRNRIFLIFALGLLLFSCCKKDDEFEDTIDENLEGLVMEIDGQEVFRSKEYSFNEDDGVLEGGRGAKLKIRLYLGRPGDKFGRRKLNEIFFEDQTFRTGYIDSTIGTVLLYENINSVTKGQIKTPLYSDNGSLLGNANIQWKKCPIIQDTFNDGWLCGFIDDENYCFGEAIYENDNYGNHKWTFRNSNLDFLTVMMPSWSLMVRRYDVDSLFQSNQALRKPIIRYRRRNSVVPIQVNSGHINILAVDNDQIIGQIDLEMETSGEILIIREFLFEVRTR